MSPMDIAPRDPEPEPSGDVPPGWWAAVLMALALTLTPEDLASLSDRPERGRVRCERYRNL